jgi:hypothetical protein
MIVTVLVDAENVRRSLWPNIGPAELVDLVERWARQEGHEALVVFEDVESADDRIARWAADLEGPYWLVTSDRELRARAGEGAERVLGGGTFARMLRELER